jgi:hypothetical protein
MEHTGKAQNPFEALQDFFQGITYKLNEWTDKAFHDQAKIADEMTETGKASDQSWIRHDLEVTGREGLDHPHSLSKPKTELAEDVTQADHEKYIASDMLREGRTTGASFRKDHDRNRLTFEDMKLTGLGGSFSEERIRQDMEHAGHAGGFSGKTRVDGNVQGPQYRQELQEFQSMKHARPKAPVEPAHKSGTLAVVSDSPKQEMDIVDKVDDNVGGTKKEGHKKEALKNENPKKEKGFVRQLMPKVRHPRTSWNDL